MSDLSPETQAKLDALRKRHAARGWKQIPDHFLMYNQEPGSLVATVYGRYSDAPQIHEGADAWMAASRDYSNALGTKSPSALKEANRYATRAVKDIPSAYAFGKPFAE